ncbi:MAG TPA: hypothetical protein PKG90_13820 [Chitinophagaceae bacterium]|nr:hypothetical protein [Chitinophagaceae bacterium]
MKRILYTFLLFCGLSDINAQTNSQAEDWYGPVTISFHGFICNRPTNDDPLGGDGVSDEVSVHFWDWTTVANNRANYNGMTKIYGEDFLLPNRVKAGTATNNGGIKAGDSYYREAVYGDGDPQILSNYAIINTFCSGNTLIAILPTIWERDNGTLGVTPIQNFGVATNSAFNDMAIRQKIWDFRDHYTYNDNNPYGFFLAGRYIGLDAKYAGLFTATKNKLASRPIRLFSNWDFSSELIILTPKIIKIISEKDYGYGKGILPVMFNEESMGNTVGHGNYILLLRFVSDIKDRNANNQPSNLFSVGVKVNNVVAGEEFKFRLQSGARYDSVTIRSPNTTVNFTTKIAAGQQYYVTQTAGPRSCQLTNYIGTISRDTVVTASCGLSSATYKVSVRYSSSLMPVNDRYELELATGERIVIDTGHRVVSFPRNFNTGESYRVRQVSVPRDCNLTTFSAPDSIAQGIIGTEDVSILLYCIPPPMSILKMRVTGIETGESFSFSDNYGRSPTFTFPATISLGGFPVGDPLIIKQTRGPRPCVITPASGVVPSDPITIQCDCSKPFTPPPPPANTYDLISRSSDDKILSSYYESWAPVIAGKNEDEGRFVAFTMYGKGIDGSSGNYRQVFWRDRKGGITKLVSKNAAGEEGDGNCFSPSISADGRSVVFESYAKNLASTDGNSVRDVYLWNEATGAITHISKSSMGETGNGESYEPVISGDGNTVAYTSNASNIVKLEPVFSTPNVYVHDVRSGITSFITKDYETGKAAGGYAPSISDDGTKIAFCAFTNRLVRNDNNNLWDIFLWEKGSGNLKRISVPGVGTERDQGNESSSRVVWASISGDGSSIVFATTSTTLTGADRNGMQDIFLYNTGTNSIKRVSTLNNTTEGDGDSPISQGERVGISYDGNWITYNTNATNFGVPKGNIVLQNTATGKIIPVTSITSGSTARPMLSRHGYYVVAGCSESYDKRFSSSGLFAFYCDINK